MRCHRHLQLVGHCHRHPEPPVIEVMVRIQHMADKILEGLQRGWILFYHDESNANKQNDSSCCSSLLTLGSSHRNYMFRMWGKWARAIKMTILYLIRRIWSSAFKTSLQLNEVWQWHLLVTFWHLKGQLWTEAGRSMIFDVRNTIIANVVLANNLCITLIRN